MRKTSLTKQDLSILIGNSLDHFDTNLYGFIAPLLSKIFFPNHDPIVSLILTYSVLASSLITRPIGAIIFSIIAKRCGAVLALSHSLIGVAATILIGVIPTYEMIGWVSPLILIILRMVQGMFAEGENSIAKLYILENKAYDHAFKDSILYQLSTMAGIIIASSVSAMIFISNTPGYWRLCFILGGSVGVIGYYLRLSATTIQKIGELETKLPTRLSYATNLIRNSINLITNNGLNIVFISIINGFSYMTYAIPFIVMNSFVPLITSITIETMMAYNTLLLVIDGAMFIAILPLIGYLTKKYSPTKIMIITSTVLFFSIIPLWIGMNNASLCYVTFVRLWIIILGVIFACPLNIWVNSLLPKTDKYLLSSIGNAVGSSILGRFTPAICISLWHFTNSSISIAIYIAIITLITIGALRKSIKRKY